MKKTFVPTILVASACAIYLFGIRPWHLRWGATAEEVERSLPGDEVAPHPDFNATRAVTIHAQPQEIWPWILQIGYGRAGWYSYDCIDNQCKPSARHIIPELQQTVVGDKIPISAWFHQTVKAFEPDHYMLWETSTHDGTWLWYLDPIGDKSTRLITRMRYTYHWTSPLILLELAVDVGDIVMLRKSMLGIKERAEALSVAPNAAAAVSRYEHSRCHC